MKCTSCGLEAAADFAFCPRCGSRLPVACPSCGSACPPDFAFCPRCGARLAAPPAGQPATPPSGARPTPTPDPTLTRPREEARAPEGVAAAEADRRPVTVLFADLSGFTALSERLDPEEVRALQADLFQEMASAIDRYEGFREKFVGDAVMAVFGAPAAHEDDPERALRAALAMLERMEALNRRWERRLGRPLALHVGVNTGPVVAGNLGAIAGAAYAVTGDTVNVASRLLSAAQAGQVLVGPATYRLTQHAFAFEPLGELSVKGKADPLPVYRVLGVLQAPRSPRGLEAQGLVAPLVGRDDELSQMLTAFDRMRHGRAQVVSLIGEAGAGKSRLLREFLDTLETQGHLATTTVRRAACSSLGEQTYGVAAAFFREAYGITSDDTLEAARGKLAAGLRALGADHEEVQRIAPILGFVLGLESEEPLRHIAPEQLKRQIFLALRTLVERRRQHGPLVLAVEDLHWADAASVELLRFLVDRLAEGPLMLAVTHRPNFDVRALVTSRVTHTAIRLVPLSTADSQALFRAFFGPSSSRLPARLCQLIVTRAGGNPLYLEEVVRNLITGGVLVREETGWTCAADVAAVDVPPSIQALLLARLDRLPPQARRLIQEAAVLGPAFDPTLLRMIAGEAQSFESSLDLLVEAELLEEFRGSRGEPESPGTAQRPYRFPHALL